MVRYLASGYRDFKKRPVPVMERMNWEIYVVAEGQMAPSFPDRAEIPLRQHYAWVIPPGLAYGWRSGKKPPRRYVIHVTSVPAALKQAADERGYFGREISEQELEQIDKLYRRFEKHSMSFSPISELKVEKAVIDLALLLLGSMTLTSKVPLDKMDEQRVESVLIWYREHMNESPTIDAAASVINVSAGHLRRIFRRARGCSPHDAFMAMRLEQAKELLSSTSQDLMQIGMQCGFHSDSDFCRVFSKHYGISPHKWRTNIDNRDTGTQKIQTTPESS